MEISLPIAFLAGVLSSMAPCCIPLLPSYIAYISGVHSEKQKKGGEGESLRLHILFQTFLFVFGFTSVFVMFGLAIGGLSSLIRTQGLLIQRVGGILFIMFGLQILGVLPEYSFGNLSESIRVKSSRFGGHLRSFLFGIVYGTIWTPCVGPILGTILTVAAFSGASFNGGLLLFMYALGVSIPFWLVGIFFTQSDKLFKGTMPFFAWLHKSAGVLLIIMGVLFITNGIAYINLYLTTMLNFDFLYNWEEKLYKFSSQ